ncbi:MAG TPA: hypothetical protein VNT54_14490 [Solirubrobacteraceae bacterium]|nr:hypothetical protein [Solirubrobacteraceae bacterium]
MALEVLVEILVGVELGAVGAGRNTSSSLSVRPSRASQLDLLGVVGGMVVDAEVDLATGVDLDQPREEVDEHVGGEAPVEDAKLICPPLAIALIMFAPARRPAMRAIARWPLGASPACGMRSCIRIPDSSPHKISAPSASALRASVG